MKIKKLSYLMITLFVICFVASYGGAQAFGDNKNGATQIVKVGYDSSQGTFISNMSSTNNKGIGYEIFEKIEEISNFEFQYVEVKGDLIEAIEDGLVDTAGFLVRSDERKERVLFSENPLSKTTSILVTDDHDILYNDPSAIDGKTVATYPDNPAQENFEIYCEKNNISVEYVYGSITEFMELEADFYISYAQNDEVQGMKNVLNLGVYHFYMMSSKENPELMEKLDNIFYQLVVTEGNFFHELEEKYVATDVELNHRSLSPSEVEALRERPIEVGYIEGYRPVSYTDENGNPAGAMIETFNNFAELYDFEVNYHPYKIEDEKEVYEEYDMLLTLFGNGSDEFYDFSTTDNFYTRTMWALVNKDDQKEITHAVELFEKELKVGMLKFISISYSNILYYYPDVEFVFYDSVDEVLDGLEDGDVDIALISDNTITYSQLYLDNTDFVSMKTSVEIPMKIYVNNEVSDTYLPILNIMLDNVSEDEYSTIFYSHSNSYHPEIGFFDMIMKYWYVYCTIALLIGVGFLAFVLYLQMNRRKELAAAYETDALTGLMAFNKFRECVGSMKGSVKANEYEVISFDVDMFKTINTHFSSACGNEVIMGITNALKSALKDTGAIITRRTADQFLILRKVDEGGTLKEIYNEYIVPNLKEVLGDGYHISMSFGNFIINNPSEKSSSIIGKADNARISNKTSHETTFSTFDAQMEKYYEDKVNVTFRMEQAILDKEFVVVFQPKVDFKTLKLGGAEALVRWHPKSGGTIYPDSFIPIFEENGFITTLDMYVFEEVCKFINIHYRKNLPRISVNLSTFSVVNPHIEDKIKKLIEKYDIEPSDIEFEITESAVVRNEGTFLEKVRSLKKLGFIISIDDFGAGVSSLNRLSAIQADILKLDKAFFDINEGEDENAQTNSARIIVSDVIRMAKHLDMKVVAEGVETFSQALWLKGICCDYAQGYYFDRPISQSEFLDIVVSDKKYNLQLDK